MASDTPQPVSGRPIDVLVGDMDGDGDDDLIANRHFFGLLLYENVSGALELLDRSGRDDAGLDVPPGVRTMFGAAGIEGKVQGPGVIAWQPRMANGELDLVLRGPAEGGPASLRISSHDRLEVERGEGWTQVSPSEVQLPFAPGGADVKLRVMGQGRTPRFDLAQLDPSGALAANPVPFYMGGDLDRFPGPRLDWWSIDPHGMAWAQLMGSAQPDLFVVRGGNVGKLTTVGVRKEHLLYRYQGAAHARFAPVPDALPPDDRRGRSAEWVDIDGDGHNELYITNRDGDNELMVWQPEHQVFQERAAAHGIGATCSELGTWLNVDQDGWQDLVLLCDGRFDVAHNLGKGAFTIEDGSRYGLRLPDLGKAPAGWLREDALHVLDLNGDDRLDLVVGEAGKDRRLLVYLGQEHGFREATAELGLQGERDTLDVRPFDADMDGWIDLLVAGASPHLLWNRGGRSLQAIPLAELVEGGVEAVVPDHALFAPLDLDGDGLLDLALCGKSWRTAHNASAGPGRSLSVFLDAGTDNPPVGTLLRATYADGHVQRQRYGSAGRTSLSQAFSALRFGLPVPGAITRLEVQWAGHGAWLPVPVPTGERTIHVPVPPITPPVSPRTGPQ